MANFCYNTVFAKTPVFLPAIHASIDSTLWAWQPMGSVRCEVYFLCFDTGGFFLRHEKFFTHQSREAFSIIARFYMFCVNEVCFILGVWVILSLGLRYPNIEQKTYLKRPCICDFELASYICVVGLYRKIFSVLYILGGALIWSAPEN